MQRTAITLACFFVYLNSFTQQGGQYPFVHYTPREGLANNRARAIFQDSKGKLYISTYAGLSVYDGSRFITYNAKNGLGMDLVNDVAEMGDDSIWIFPNANKINCLVNSKLKDFVPADGFAPLVNQFMKCSDGNYYAVADEGLFRLENKKFLKLPFPGIPDNEAKTFLQAVEIDHKLFIHANPGYKFVDARLIVYDLLKEKVLYYDKEIRGIYLFKPSANELWISSGHGMLMLDTISFHKGSINFIPLPDSYHVPKNLFPRFFYKDRQENIWFAAPTGLYKVNKAGTLTTFTTENGLSINEQTSILQDYENNMWFTNELSGLSKLTSQQLIYYPELMHDLITDEIYIHPSSDSVFVYDGHHQKLVLFLPGGQTKEYTCTTPLHKYAKFVSANYRYLLSGDGIFRVDINSGNGTYSLHELYKNSTPYGYPSAISDNHGDLVAISNKVFFSDGNKVISDTITYFGDQITVDPANRIWTALRNNQLYCFEISGPPGNRKLTRIKLLENILPGSSPRSIVADKSGNIWIGSRDWGLYCFHFDKNLNVISRQQVTTQNGLSENFVKYLFCDNENNIWACTPSGVDRIKAINNNFLVDNITRNNNIYLPISNVQQTAKGVTWILTSSGVITYDPSAPAINGWKPTLSFSHVHVNNSDKISLRSPGELKYFQNNLTFNLSAPSFIADKQTRFSYLLEGSGNENWSAPSIDAVINFVNLPPGDYTLKAKAIFLHGKYPDTESSFSFTILPPWWLTWWFKSLVALVIVGLIFLGVRFYIKRRLELQRVELERRQAIEKERTRIATDMHDDLGAGLSQIKFLSEAIGMKRQKHLPIEEEVSSIRSFSDEMIDKMGEIVWALNEKNDTLNDLLSYTRSYAVEYLGQNGINCRVKEPEYIPQLNVSGEFRRNIYLTVKESLHNILKHAQATEVLMMIEINKMLTIRIRDNGIGLNNAAKSEFGNGLNSMRNRMKELNGSFEIESNIGTEVIIKAPLS